MKLFDLFDDWLLFLVHEQGVTEATRKTYAAAVRRFLRWMETEGGYPAPTVDAFNVPTLRRFAYALGKQGLRPRSVRGVFHGVRSYGAFLLKHGALPDNPALQIGMPKKDAAERTACSDAHVLALLEACDRLASPRRIALAKALIATFAYCGLRRTEALSLRVCDIDLPTRTVTVTQGKGGKRREVPTCPECAAMWGEWLALREKDAKTDFLFLENRSRRLWYDGLHALMEEVKAVAGLRHLRELTPHVIRHNFASRMVAAGCDLKSLQTLLGHSSLIVTDRYVHANAAHIRQVANLSSLKPNPTPEPRDRQKQTQPAASRRIARGGR